MILTATRVNPTLSGLVSEMHTFGGNLVAGKKSKGEIRVVRDVRETVALIIAEYIRVVRSVSPAKVHLALAADDVIDAPLISVRRIQRGSITRISRTRLT